MINKNRFTYCYLPSNSYLVNRDLLVRHSALNVRHAQTVTGSPTDLIVDTWTPGSQWLCPTAADWRFTFQRIGYWWPAKGIAASSNSWEFRLIDGIICMNRRFCVVFSQAIQCYLFSSTQVYLRYLAYKKFSTSIFSASYHSPSNTDPWSHWTKPQAENSP